MRTLRVPSSAPRALTLAMALLAAAPLGIGAQSARTWGTSTVQFIQVRPLVVDSVLESTVSGDGLLRALPGGGAVRCIQGEEFCRYARSGATTSTAPTIHDVSATAWGFLEGVRVYTRFLMRADVGGGTDIWPRADDAFDLVLAYAEWNRRRIQVRAGRQWATSGLGYYNFDGASVRVRPWSTVESRVYGGWSLARGLNEPRTGEALAAIESFAPDERNLIVGISGSYRPSARGFVTALYQRELRQDRKGLISERAALDGLYRSGRLVFQGSLEMDIPSRVLNDATLRARATLPSRLAVNGWVRRYEPFFELWTIWGAFSPVAFSEVGVGGSWLSDSGGVGLGLTGSWRSFGDTHTSTTFGGARSTAWRIDGTVTTRVTRAVSLQGRLGTDVGMGAARSLGGVNLRWDAAEDRHLGLTLEAFQTAYEFRVEDGTVFGVGADGGVRFSDRLGVRGGLTVYHHSRDAQGADTDWSQLRGFLRLDWSVGPEAGGVMPGRNP